MLLHQEVSEYDLCLQLYSLQPDVEASRQNYFFTFHINVFKKTGNNDDHQKNYNVTL